MEQTDSFPRTPFYMFRWTRWPMRAQRKSCRFTWPVVGSLSRTTVEQSECLVGEDFGSSRLQWMLGWVRFGADFLPDWVLQCTTNHRRTGETGERGERGNVKQILTPLCLSVVCLPIQVSTNLVWTYLLQRDKLNWLQKVSLLRLDQSDKKTKRDQQQFRTLATFFWLCHLWVQSAVVLPRGLTAAAGISATLCFSEEEAFPAAGPHKNVQEAPQVLEFCCSLQW